MKAELKKLRKMYEEQIKISREEFMMVHSKKVKKSYLILIKILFLALYDIDDFSIYPKQCCLAGSTPGCLAQF